ncbi:E3 ubiquitin-protein ligase TRIM39-like isoform X2 [Hippoglossus hippoglossus]|uniref:E3 ubiquitin-protein ligase TRIM39-like isoform X2 n=2 Tax=Hippoglossus hippoglossus TaxID=8267 RepID=UPI00148BE0CF|nr:E3 ubiquitin-protein ligase TRIM39-like isoform X2 [Hippoglossus hippoglossus]
MALASCLLSEERFECSICLDVFTDPVTILCGHNFCSACINTYWDSGDTCQCPMCKRKFSTRPELQVNTDFKKLVQVKASTPGPQIPALDVLCDICSEIKEKAVKSCLTCLTSFCESHLEPHRRVAVLKGHKLLEPVKNLDDRMCKTHNKMTELYCLKEQAFICVLCFSADHKGHNAVPLEEQYEKVAATKDEAQANIQKLIQTRIEKIAEVEELLDVSPVDSEKEKQDAVQVFTELIQSIQVSQAELVEAIEQRHSAIKQKGEEFLKELRREVTELKSRSSQLEHLSQSEDHYHFLQSFPTLSKPPHKSCPDTDLCPDLSFQATRGDLTRLKQRVDGIMEEIPEIRMKRMREHAVDLTLDPDTAFYLLVISEDGKQVSAEHNIEKDKVTDNPKRFERCFQVLAKEGFTTGKFYFEVQVKGKIRWIVGVAKESVDRKNMIRVTVKNGFWTFSLVEGKYGSSADSERKILKEELQKLGVFVDYNKGEVSFYNVDSKSRIGCLTGYCFTEKLYPYFCPQPNENGKNSAPLIITPVPQMH